MATFLVERPTGGAWVAGRDTREQPLWDEHAAFMDALFEAGHVILGGPLEDEPGAVLVMEAEDEDTVRSLLAGDPWIAHDLMGVGEIRRWRLYLDARRREP